MAVLQYCPESTRVLPRKYSSTSPKVLPHISKKDCLPTNQLPIPQNPTIHPKVKGETKNARKNNRARTRISARKT